MPQNPSKMAKIWEIKTLHPTGPNPQNHVSEAKTIADEFKFLRGRPYFFKETAP